MGSARCISRCAALAVLGGATIVGGGCQLLAAPANLESAPAQIARKVDLQGAAQTQARGLLGGELAQVEPAKPAEQPSPAAAQDEAPKDAEDLEEVTVFGSSTYRRTRSSTATKTDTPILDTPQSIQVIPRQVIEDQGSVRMRDVLRNVSGLYLNNNYSNYSESFNIRGFNASQFTNAFSTSKFDSFNAVDTTNIERIEVLKGPSSVLFGQAEPAGVINYVTKRPLLQPYAAVGFTAGSYDFYRTTLDLSGPLTAGGTLAYRLTTAYEDANTFRGTQGRRVFFSPVLEWKVSPDTTLSFELIHSRDNRPFELGIPAVGTGVAPVPYNRLFADPKGLLFSNSNRAIAVLEHRFAENLTMRSAGRYASYIENSSRLIYSAGLLEDNRSLQLAVDRQEYYFESFGLQNDLIWKAKTGSVDHTVLFGLELGKSLQAGYGSFGLANVIDIYQPPPYVFEPAVESLRSPFGFRNAISFFGVYLQDQISFSDDFKLVLGGRYDTASAPNTDPITGAITPSEGQAFSPRVGLLYKPAANISLFANFNQSFAPSTGRSAAGTPFLPTRGTGYEIGAKADLLQGRLFANLALFKIAKTNVVTIDPTNPRFSIQVGEQESQGIEFDITGEILPGWNVVATYAYTDAKISRDNTYPVGNRLPTAPLHGGSLWTTYRIGEGSLEGWGAGAGVFAVGERFGDLDNSFSVPGYTRVDAALYYRLGALNAAVNFKNLFNAQFIESAVSRNGITPGAPFVVQGTLEVRF
ncbi:TonB-dependent siderophore receptor [Gloeobacter morelensis]|uniref:TonB-dependent siderophore receptor n=1 Tax=Gloeobacter morelensis MG652769 TaxID=2781736 RepID=A0ABY3PMF1_9CYAN|nr:TonB-dependent siderophore receptor [Gloeobacter morelensis]UFP94764.1 TonB-dependent siderophore receptor [Gloeobacter morelensis MG652769]